MRTLIDWFYCMWVEAHYRLLEDIQRRESMARIRWARAMHEAEKCYRDNNYY